MNREEIIARYKEESAKHRDVAKRVRHHSKYKEWQKSVIRRDEYTCQECRKQIFSGLHAHHKEKLNWIILKNEIVTLRQALDCKELWNLDNGISLCTKCHNAKKRN